MAKKLVNLLLAKSVLETIFVGALAVVVYIRAFPPTFHGWGEAVVESRSISGWAVDNADPSRHVEVYLFIDGNFVGSAVARQPRPDVVAAGWAKDELHGYNFFGAFSVGTHEARVYAVHKSDDRFTLQMLGDPIRFEVEINDSWKRR